MHYVRGKIGTEARHNSQHKKSQSATERNFLGRSLIKNQSAMEYLMTYGWAILIIAVVLVALFQMGVFNSANFAPKAQPGSCQVFRTTAATSLEGTCNNELPQYVAQFDNANILITGISFFSDPYSVSVWFNPSVSAGFLFGRINDGNWYVQLSGGVITDWASGSSLDWNTVVPYTANKWQNLVFVYDGTTKKIYSNGILTASVTQNSLAGSGLYIGRYEGYTTSAFQGSISNIQIYNTSLTANDIASLYQEGIGGAPQNTQNLVGWWPLNGNANDYSGNNNNGAAVNVVYTGSWEEGYSQP